MPTKSTLRRGAMTSRRRLPAAAASSARLGRPDHVADGLAVLLELDEAFLFRVLEKVRKGLVAIVGLVEAWITALESLLHHRAPDLLVGAALGDEGLQRAEHHVERLLL